MPAIRQIFAKTDSLNGAQKRLGHYLQNDSSALLLSNVRDLAQAVGVSKSTVVRFAKSLGYKGFPGVQAGDSEGDARQAARRGPDGGDLR